MSVVLITGCSSGFGLETALAFARRGDVTYASMRDSRRATALLQRAEAEDLDVEILALDVTNEASVAAAVRHVEDRHGAIDVLVNNAGIDHAGPVETMPIERVRAMRKHALGVLSESLASEVGIFGVRVVCLEPSFYATGITDRAWTDDHAHGPHGADYAWVRAVAGPRPAHREEIL
jgi:NAD(P)-dependent dehydrogenase (short-subunit alcohol dehydrogenase family)